ncbi:MAG: T9SS type A sorting domain-containing protein [Bacteroidales bacterium]|nr:T9SS type A sorting domain-containing protein [Bacteroidales bacterium]
MPAQNKTTIGLEVANSGSAENEVYKNTYNSLYIAQQFICHNSSQSGIPSKHDSLGIVRGITGLQTLCNTFNSSVFRDVLVGGIPSTHPSTCLNGLSIRKDQGSSTKPAGNLFNNNTVINIDNSQSPFSIDYYFKSSSGNENPLNTTNVNKIPLSSSNTCPSKIGGPPSKGGVFDLENALAQYDEMNREYEKWVDNLLTFDGDDEEGYNALLDMVSYYSSLKDLFFNSIIIAVSGRQETGDGNMDDVLNQSESAQSESSEFKKFEQLRYLFSYRNNYTDNLCIVEAYLAESNYSDALASLENIFNQFEVTDEQTNELTGLRIYTLWLQQLENANSNIYTLSDEDIVYLINYVETHIGRGAVFAHNILCGLYGICIEEEGNGRQEAGDGIQNTGDRNNEEMLNQSKSAQSVSSEFEKSITIIPNPTTGELQVTSYELQVTSIDVFDIYGRAVSTHCSLLTTHYPIDLSHLPNGIYFVKIVTEQGEVVKKVVKQ